MRYVTGAAFGLLLLASGSTVAVAAPFSNAALPAPANGAIIRVAANPTVVWVQRYLMEQGIFNGAIDGVAGPHTQAAVRAYEASVNWPITGDPYVLASRLGYGTPTAPVVVVPAPGHPVVVAPAHRRHPGPWRP